jgi:hypothetical protein
MSQLTIDARLLADANENIIWLDEHGNLDIKDAKRIISRLKYLPNLELLEKFHIPADTAVSEVIAVLDNVLCEVAESLVQWRKEENVEPDLTTKRLVIINGCIDAINVSYKDVFARTAAAPTSASTSTSAAFVTPGNVRPSGGYESFRTQRTGQSSSSSSADHVHSYHDLSQEEDEPRTQSEAREYRRSVLQAAIGKTAPSGSGASPKEPYPSLKKARGGRKVEDAIAAGPDSTPEPLRAVEPDVHVQAMLLRASSFQDANENLTTVVDEEELKEAVREERYSPNMILNAGILQSFYSSVSDNFPKMKISYSTLLLPP